MPAAIEPQGVSSFTGQLHAIEQSIPGSRKRGRVGHPGGRPRAIALSAPQSADMPQHGQLRSLAAGISQGSPPWRHLAGHGRQRAGRHDDGPGRHRPRPQARLLCAKFPRLLRQADFPEPHPERHRPPETAPRPVRQGREAVRRARPRDHRLLGARERLRFRCRQAAHPARARDIGLRLPAPGHVSNRTHGCDAHHRPWRSRRPRR